MLKHPSATTRGFHSASDPRLQYTCVFLKLSSGLEKKTGHMPATDKHLIPFTDADRHNDRFVVGGKPKGGTSRFETYATMHSYRRAVA